jgi:hypothetical protein
MREPVTQESPAGGGEARPTLASLPKATLP